MEKSPIQTDDLGGKWTPKGSYFMCPECLQQKQTQVDILLLPNEIIVCHECADEHERPQEIQSV
jgi:hypothetical protein